MSERKKFLLDKANMPPTVAESNLLAKQIKQIEANGRGQQQVLVKGFKDLNEILLKLMETIIDKDDIKSLKLKVDFLENKIEENKITSTCTHVCKWEEKVDSVENSIKSKKSCYKCTNSTSVQFKKSRRNSCSSRL